MKKLLKSLFLILICVYGFHYTSYPYNKAEFSDAPPSDEVKSQLCIVTGADHNYFGMLSDLLDSVKATKNYRDVPIMIIDGGLTEEDKKALVEKYNAVIRDPGFDFEMKEGTPNHFKALTARPFLHKHFPGYRYYLWLDSDAWVHDEWALNSAVNLSVKQGWSLCAESIINPLNLKQYKIMPFADLYKIVFKYPLNAGFFCIDSKSGYFEKWGEYMKKINNGSFKYMNDQLAANYVYYTSGLAPMMHSENYVPLSAGYPIVQDTNNTLRNPWDFKPIGFLHLAYNKVVRDSENPVTDVPIFVKNCPLSVFEWGKNLYKSFGWHKSKPDESDFEAEGYRRLPIRYVRNS